MKLERRVRVRNQSGLHARPATALVKLLQRVSSSVWLRHRKETVNAKSIMSILMLAAKKNALIEITVDGEDAEITMTHLITAFEKEFGD